AFSIGHHAVTWESKPSKRFIRREIMKFTRMKWSALPVAVLMAGSVAMAQAQSSSGSQHPAPAPAATPAPAEKPKPTIAQRKEIQQDRIANGVQSGQLT